MNVKQLIRELKKMPQHLEVDVAMNDNEEFISAGNVCHVMRFVKTDYDVANMRYDSVSSFETMPDECVILRC